MFLFLMCCSVMSFLVILILFDSLGRRWSAIVTFPVYPYLFNRRWRTLQNVIVSDCLEYCCLLIRPIRFGSAVVCISYNLMRIYDAIMSLVVPSVVHLGFL